MKYYNYISIILFASLAALSSCTQDESLNGEENTAKSFQIFVNDTGFNADNTTRATENDYATKFVNGDAIGIFAVRNGEIVSDINNVKCAMTNGAWEMEKNISYKESEFKTMSFYAYYPYNAEFNSDTDFDASKTLTDSDPFDNYVKNWKVDVQQNEENYTQYDLMTSVGKASGQRLKGEVSFIMQHRMALAVIQMPDLVYNFTNANIDTYTVPTQAGTFQLNAKEAKPYEQDINSQTYYRFLIKPNEEFTIKGTYLAGTEEKTYDHAATLTNGQAKLYKVKNPEAIQLQLSVGDYFCADGSIVSKDTETVPENAIGVVMHVGNPQPSATHSDKYNDTNDALKRDYPSCTHGLVMALNNTQSDYSIYGGTALYHGAGGEDYVGCNTGNKTIPNSMYPGYLGYNNTALLSLFYDSGDPKRCEVAYNQLSDYLTNVPVPATASTWYIPCMEELNSIRDNITVLNATINKTNGTQLVAFDDIKVGFYWSSNERNNNTQWIHRLQSDIEGSWTRRDTSSSGSYGYFRLVLAF